MQFYVDGYRPGDPAISPAAPGAYARTDPFPDEVDVRAVFPRDYLDLSVSDLPELLHPARGRLGLRDYEKAFARGRGHDIFRERGIDRTAGALVVVRPDQYVARVLPLDAFDELDAFLGQVLREAAA